LAYRGVYQKNGLHVSAETLTTIFARLRNKNKNNKKEIKNERSR
jgi:hypothetical protein